ncbi:MAG: phosphatase PAP2 family protein [Spirochaetaceae bacterium]|nr:MAG: phosphatase PAP2 family protein [Spirochaetaceae bacterium]
MNWSKTQRRYVVCASVFLGAGLGLLLTTLEFSRTTVHPLELEIFSALTERRSPALTFVMEWVSHLGATVTIFALAGLVPTALYRSGYRQQAVPAGLGILAGLLLNPVLKLYFARPRPDLEALARLPSSFAFPSGHTVGATVGYGMVALVLLFLHQRGHFRQSPYLVPVLVPLLLLLIVAIGLTRIYLAVHWPSDVLAGWCFGTMILCVAYPFLAPEA